MPYITRLDSRTIDNKVVQIKDKDGEVIIEIIARSPCELAINTIDGLQICKPQIGV